MLHLRCSSYGKVGIASSSRKLDVAMPFETTNAGPAAPPLQQSSGFAPLKIPLFRDRWIASTVSSVGTWMQDTAGTWLMTSLTASPLLIALMQTAASLPVLLLGLLAGATADIFDRRKLLIFWQAWMLGSVGILAILTFIGSVFFLNAVSFAGVIWVLYNWKRIPLFKSALPSERIAASIRSGLRYVRYAPELQASLVRAFTFPFFVSAIWALLAVVARTVLHQGALAYGILNGSLGLGAVIGATLLPRIRHRFSADQILTAASLYNVATLLILAYAHIPAVIILTLILSGFAWTS